MSDILEQRLKILKELEEAYQTAADDFSSELDNRGVEDDVSETIYIAISMGKELGRLSQISSEKGWINRLINDGYELVKKEAHDDDTSHTKPVD